MFSKLLTIIICFSIAFSSRFHSKILNNVDEQFVKSKEEAGSDDHAASCGKPYFTPNTYQKIMGGEEAIPHSWPWQVSVQIKGYSDNYCGGTIISATKIISAAHCFANKKEGTMISIKNIYVIAGIHSILDSYSPINSQTKKVIKLVPHNNYNPKLSGTPNDIAILYIETPGFTLNDKVQPVCLPSSDIPFGLFCYTTGWGDLWEKQLNDNKTLYQVRLPLIYYPTCSYWLGESVKTTMICAGYAEGGKDTCSGDSGGPLVCNRDGVWVLDGVTSWGIGCGRPKSPGVFTKVFDYLTWINSN